jgi:ABC-type glutathione transport system ATPase component
MYASSYRCGNSACLDRRAVHAVEDISLALHPGRCTALADESGSGKTTVALGLWGTTKRENSATAHKPRCHQV